MISQWYKLKASAISLRKNGVSIRKIENRLKIPRSTLSYWFKNINLTNSQKAKLNKNLGISLSKARKKALIWHKEQKEMHLAEAKAYAESFINRVDISDKNFVELALAFLYLGEGKKTGATSMGNSDPNILKFFILATINIFNDAKLAKCELHLRSDQNELDEIRYWSKQLSISSSNFSFVKDKRIAKSKTYLDYHGVCVVRFTSLSIQRKLMFLSRKFCNIISSLDA